MASIYFGRSSGHGSRLVMQTPFLWDYVVGRLPGKWSTPGFRNYTPFLALFAFETKTRRMRMNDPSRVINFFHYLSNGSP